MKLCVPVLSAAAVLAISGTAFAGGPTVFSFNFQNLSGSYNTGTTTFAAVAAAGPSQINSLGSVSRTAPPAGVANYSAGFVAGLDPSDFQLSMSVSDGLSNMSGYFASGFGTFTVVDVHGDTLTGTISGDRNLGLGFAQFGSSVNYFGELTNVVFTPLPASGNTTWDGPNGGSFDFTTIPGGPTFNGFIVQLFIDNTALTPFTANNWGGVNDPVPVGINAELVPAPGAAALLGLGGLMAARRRRR